mgnify:CR=1 FL=1
MSMTECARQLQTDIDRERGALRLRDYVLAELFALHPFRRDPRVSPLDAARYAATDPAPIRPRST